jgi:hypothetical protein
LTRKRVPGEVGFILMTGMSNYLQALILAS